MVIDFAGFDPFPLVKWDQFTKQAAQTLINVQDSGVIGQNSCINSGINNVGYCQTLEYRPQETYLTYSFGGIPTNLWSDNEHPRCEQYEDDEHNLVLKMVLAGYPKANIAIEYVDNTLEIRAEKVENSHKSSLIAQRAFTKRFTDSRGMWDMTALKAKYEDGILTLVIPRKASKIPVTVTIE